MHNISLKYKRQTGVALITALLIVALAATAAAYLTNSHQLSIRRSGNIINGNQAYEYVLGAEALAIIALNEDFKDPQNKTDGFSDLWALGIPPFPIEGGVVTGRITDLQGLFNLNSLLKNGNMDVTAGPRFQNLLRYFELDPQLLDAVIDWMDADVNPRGSFGAEDDYYMGLERPYRPANTLFTSVSELRMVRGFDVKQFDLLSAVLTALPVHTPININSAPMEIHIAIGVDEPLAEALDQNPDKDENLNKPDGSITTDAQTDPRQRAVVEFDSIDDYAQRANLTDKTKRVDLSVTSSFFLFEGEARIDRGYSLLKTILYRDNSGNIRVLMRSQGTL